MKPVVHYQVAVLPPIGGSAYVYPVDHPSPLVSNTKAVRTSPVVRIDGDEFETENTIYRLCKKQ